MNADNEREVVEYIMQKLAPSGDLEEAVYTLEELHKETKASTSVAGYKNKDVAGETTKPKSASSEVHKMTDIQDTIDKININMPGADGGGNAALLAMLAGNNNRDGMSQGIWPILLLALLGRNGGGLLGGGNGDSAGVVDVNNTIFEQFASLTNLLNAGQTATQAAIGSVKDTVQNSALLTLQQGSANTQSILTAIAGVTSKMDANTIAELAAEVASLKGTAAAKGVEVTVSQNVVQAQAQAQQQAQLQGLFTQFANIANDLQQVKQGQVIFNSGLMAGSGTQAAANTRVA